jgi:hypothetical protein
MVQTFPVVVFPFRICAREIILRAFPTTMAEPIIAVSAPLLDESTESSRHSSAATVDDTSRSLTNVVDDKMPVISVAIHSPKHLLVSDTNTLAVTNAATTADEKVELNIPTTSPKPSLRSLSPTLVQHRHSHVYDAYMAITPVQSPKKHPVPLSSQNDAAAPSASSPANKIRPHLNLNLNAVCVARPGSAHARNVVTSANGRVRKVTRDIAALDFLQNIPMMSEYQSCNFRSSSGTKQLPLSSPGHPFDPMMTIQDHQHHAMEMTADDVENPSLAGRRLPGPESTIVNIPPLFRYRIIVKSSFQLNRDKNTDFWVLSRIAMSLFYCITSIWFVFYRIWSPCYIYIGYSRMRYFMGTLMKSEY